MFLASQQNWRWDSKLLPLSPWHGAYQAEKGQSRSGLFIRDTCRSKVLRALILMFATVLWHTGRLTVSAIITSIYSYDHGELSHHLLNTYYVLQIQ